MQTTMQKQEQILELSRLAQVFHDEHGFHESRGDYLVTKPVDLVTAPDSMRPPFWDFGGAGLALVEIVRKRVYSKTAFKRVGYASTMYLIGRNETGSYFAHPVHKTCGSVREACNWIWDNKTVLARQGDIALVKGVRGRLHDDMPLGVPELPDGHVIEGEFIVHRSHPPLMLPTTGQRIIVGKRAAVYASQATRD